MMKLLTKTVEKMTPAIGDTENIAIGEKTATARFFNPVGHGTWYMIEMDPKTGEAFGMCHIFEWELGYFDLTELQSLKLPMGLGIERDICFQPTKLKEIGEIEEYFKWDRQEEGCE